MKYIPFFFIISLLLITCRQTESEPGKKLQNKPEVFYFHLPAHPAQIRNPGVFDTLTYWKQLFRYFEIPDSLTREELRDRLELTLNTLQKIKQKPYPAGLDTVDIKSRMLLLENEALQLKWILKNDFTEPAPDSIFSRMIYFYNNLITKINNINAGKADFEEVFKQKMKRDSILQEKFNKK
jgi:hypothetical protein